MKRITFGRCPNRLVLTCKSAMWSDIDSGGTGRTMEAGAFMRHRETMRGHVTRDAHSLEKTKAEHTARLGAPLPHLLCGHAV